MKNGCTVTDKEIKTPVCIAGATPSRVATSYFSESLWAFGRLYPQGPAHDYARVFDFRRPFFVPSSKSGTGENQKICIGGKCITPSTNCRATRRSSSSKFASTLTSLSACPGAWRFGPRGNTPTGNKKFQKSSCANFSARSISLSKRWTRRGNNQKNYRYLTA